ncbi:MAG: LPXTG cell wall anchor domain-containing protein [Marmoricola sp.]
MTLGFSSSAQAYPDVQVNLTVTKQIVYGGDSFTATTESNVTCDFSTEWGGTTRPGTGTSFSTEYVAPAVTRITKVPLTGECTYLTPSGSGRATSAPTTWKHTMTITVLPRANAAVAAGRNSTDLPSTGGPNWAFLAGGLGLVLVGAVAVTVARRRAEEADLPLLIS